MSLFKFIDKRVCPCKMNTTVVGTHVEMSCVLPRGHQGQHLSPWGRWFNRQERDDNISKLFDNDNAKSKTGRRVIFLGKIR